MRKIELKMQMDVSESHYQALFEWAPIGMCETDPYTGRFLRVNNKMCNIAGYSKDELLSMTIFQLSHPEEREQDRHLFQQVVCGEKPDYSSEKRCICKDGSLIWVNLAMTVLQDMSDQPLRVMAAVADITERKQLEEERIQEGLRYKTLFERATDGIFVMNKHGYIVEVNEAFATMHGYTLDEIRKMHIQDLDVHDLIDIFPERHRRSMAGEKLHFEVEHYHKDGHILTLSVQTNTIELDGEPQILCFHHDVTAYKAMERILREEKNRIQTYLDIAGVMFIVLNANGEIILANRKATEILGYDQQNIIKKNWFDHFIPADIRGQVRHVFNRLMAGDLELFENYENSVLTQTGKERVIAWQNTLLKDTDGSYLGTLSSGVDITDRKQAETALRENEEKLRRLYENMVQGVFYQDANGTFLDINPAGMKMFGQAKDQLVGKSSYLPEWKVVDEKFNILKPEQYPSIVALKTGQEVDMEIGIFNPIIQDYKWLMVNAKPQFRQGGEYVPFQVFVTMNDITERKQAEEERERLQNQLTQAQKMESIGRLAGGVAHDFNNMLTVINGYAMMILKKPEIQGKLRTHLEEILDAGRRSADLTRQLLAFARKQTIAPQVLDLNETVEGMLKMLRRLIGEDIDLIWLPGTRLWKINMDPSQIDQILANLFVNARDAIEGVGKVSIETANVTFNESYMAVQEDFTPGEYVMLAVSDNGSGMDEETKTRIFEPFFTTKGMGQGTGLGLATVYGIVKQNNGYINIYSELGCGTTFKIYIPRHAEEVSSASSPNSPESPQGHGEVILMVEDEAATLALVRIMLEKIGYKVLTASTPTEAIHVVREREEKIDLLITDVIMPEMDGKELAEQLQVIRPGLPCLFMSGYTADVISHRGILHEGVKFIQKPVSIDDLAVKIKDILRDE